MMVFTLDRPQCIMIQDGVAIDKQIDWDENKLLAKNLLKWFVMWWGGGGRRGVV